LTTSTKGFFPSSAPHRSDNLITTGLGRKPSLAGKQSARVKDLAWTKSLLIQTSVGDPGVALDPTRGLLTEANGAATNISKAEDVFQKAATPESPQTARL
jgi:hypothetical protein